MQLPVQIYTTQTLMCPSIDILKEEEEEEEITPELVARLVTRPEDLPHNVATNIKKYRDMMLRTLEVKIELLWMEVNMICIENTMPMIGG